MSDTETAIHEIKLRPQSSLCEVITGPSRRVYVSTRHAVGMALLQDVTGIDQETGSTRGLVWTDMLTTHGLAVGTKGAERIVVATVPETKRTVRWTGIVYASPTAREGQVETQPLTVTYPPMLAMLRTKEARYVKAYLFCLLPSAFRTCSVNNEAGVLSTFPYGNVYNSSGRICWGGVPHGTVNTIEDLLHTFFTSGFNMDLCYPTVCESRARTMHEMAQATKGMLPPPAASAFSMGLAQQIRALLGRNEE